MTKIQRLVFIVLFAALGALTAHAQKTLHLDVYTACEDGWRVDSTVVSGQTEAILIDTQYLKTEATKLADRITASGKKLKAIIVTHPHDEHYLGIGTLHQRFPNGPIYMSSDALEDFKQKSPDALAGMKKYVPAEVPESSPTGEVFPPMHFTVDGQSVELMQGQGDDSKTSNTYIWIPPSERLSPATWYLTASTYGSPTQMSRAAQLG